MLCPLQAVMCQAFLRSNSFNPPRTPTESELLPHFADTWLFRMPHTAPSPELPVMVMKVLVSPVRLDCWLLLPLWLWRAYTVDPFIPASLVTWETQVGAVRGPEPSQASPQKSAFFLLEVTCSSLPERERPNVRYPCPLLTKFLYSQNLKTRSPYGSGEWK